MFLLLHVFITDNEHGDYVNMFSSADVYSLGESEETSDSSDLGLGG